MGSSPDSRWIPATCFTDCGGQKCLLKVEIRDGHITRIKTDDVGEDSASCPQVRACGRGYALKHFLHSDARVKYPMKRAGCPYGMLHVDIEGGLATKCDLCVDLLARGERPACVAACPMRALDVGYIDELRRCHESSAAWAQLEGAEQTRPAILIRSVSPQ